MRLPEWGQLEPLDHSAATLERVWKKIEKRGTCQVELIFDLPGAARYVTKQLIRPGYLEQIILANDFHPHRDRNSVDKRRGQKAFSKPTIDLS
jgi:hypothetical protein